MGGVIDLSQTLEEHMPHFPTHSKFFHNLWSSYDGRALAHYLLVMHEHNGTHVDAPVHFLKDAPAGCPRDIDRVPLTQLWARMGCAWIVVILKPENMFRKTA